MPILFLDLNGGFDTAQPFERGGLFPLVAILDRDFRLLQCLQLVNAVAEQVAKRLSGLQETAV